MEGSTVTFAGLATLLAGGGGLKDKDTELEVTCGVGVEVVVGVVPIVWGDLAWLG